MSYLGVSSQFKNLVRGSHVMDVRCEAYYGGKPGDASTMIGTLKVTGGSVTIDQRAQIRRTASITVADVTEFPEAGDTNDLLSDYGTKLKLYRGVITPSGVTEWCPLGVFRVDSPSVPIEPGVISVSLSDLTASIQEARFEQPSHSTTTNQIRAEIARLVRDAMGTNQGVQDMTGSITLVPALIWDVDRWQAIVDLATSIGAECFFGPDGTFIIRPVPDPTKSLASWYASYTDIIVQGTRTIDRSETYNAVVATGERTDGLAPARAVVRDTNASSPTYYLGPFGWRPYFYSSPVLTTTTACTNAATTILNRVTGMARQVTFDTICDPSLDGGDIAQITFPDGATERHILDQLVIPLDPQTAMRVTSRTNAPFTASQ